MWGKFVGPHDSDELDFWQVNDLSQLEKISKIGIKMLLFMKRRLTNKWGCAGT